MKAVPKVNTDGLYMEDVLVDDAFNGVVPFYNEPLQPAVLDGAASHATDSEDEDEGQRPEAEVAGYMVGIPVSPGLFHPRFDLVGWLAYQEALAAAQAEYQQALNSWHQLPQEERGQQPVLLWPSLPELWEEGLSPEEIEELTKPQPAVPGEVDRLGAELVARELEALELRRQNEALGAQVVGLELRMLSLETNSSEGEGTYV
ncbi:hypothetical protein GNP94_11145 [Paenibacillus campinasensis]|uniref:Uncharacterized protein n=1 Tax=Paenibacillus campinasensis TaxID=66347 RepID=A0ABW9SZU6_9BACL|nr:hypothetical protein [Paenibacillus campinasensis]MUG66555.1 hypothetical protein [Paenibacillus campinasensis]